jgi:hypothetical protein
MHAITLNPPPAGGAGIPSLERLALKYWWIRKARQRLTWSKARARFFHAGHRAIDLVASLPEELLDQPARIARLPGLEPRSCDYSMADTIEHLGRYADWFADLLHALAVDAPIPAQTIEGLKPQGRSGPAEILRDFEVSLARLGRVLDEWPEAPAQGTTAEHPWFGPLDAHGWLVMGALHQRLHLAQLERIADALGVPRRPAPIALPEAWWRE